MSSLIEWKTIMTTLVGAMILFVLNEVYNKVEQIPVINERLAQVQKDVDRIKNIVLTGDDDARIVKLQKVK